MEAVNEEANHETQRTCGTLQQLTSLSLGGRALHEGGFVGVIENFFLAPVEGLAHRASFIATPRLASQAHAAESGTRRKIHGRHGGHWLDGASL